MGLSVPPVSDTLLSAPSSLIRSPAPRSCPSCCCCHLLSRQVFISAATAGTFPASAVVFPSFLSRPNLRKELPSKLPAPFAALVRSVFSDLVLPRKGMASYTKGNSFTGQRELGCDGQGDEQLLMEIFMKLFAT